MYRVATVIAVSTVKRETDEQPVLLHITAYVRLCIDLPEDCRS